jgi:hypothetical protein
MTPAQASGHPNFVTDVPVQGPTDEGLRAADCWWVQNRLPKNPACVDCEGPIPQWARNTLCPGNRLTNSGLGENMFNEKISYGSPRNRNFALAAAGDPEIWTGLTSEQQQWVMNTLVTLNNLIVQTTGTTCPTFGPSVTAAGGCFQAWYNTNYLPLNPQAVELRTDGVFDQDTLDALRLIAALDPSSFPEPFPGTRLPGFGPPDKKKLSTGAMVGIAAAGAAVVGGLVWAAGRGGKTRRRR